MNEAARPAAPQEDLLREWLAGGEFRIGEIYGKRRAGGAWTLCHRDDFGREPLSTYETADAASEIARYDDAGAYRPLKTAPNLRHGWLLVLHSADNVLLALNLFYPGRLVAWTAWRRNTLPVTPFRETLARQTGMYRVAAKITDDQGDELIARFCRSDGGCLRTILWPRDRSGTIASTKLPPSKFDPGVDQTGRSESATPLLCQEICNLLVAEARAVVKAAE